MKAVDYIRKGWTQGALARNSKGRKCDPTSDQAVAWCSQGALIAAYGRRSDYRHAKAKLYKILGSICLLHLPRWNDNKRRTRQQVIEAMEKAGV